MSRKTPIKALLSLLLCLFSDIASVAGQIEGLDFATGKALFDKNWVPAPSSTTASDGLGPFYDARSCAQCHPDGGRGSRDASLTLHIDDPVYGRQLQKFAVTGLVPEARVQISESPNEAGVEVSALRYGPLSSEGYSARIAPSLRGIGLLAQVPEADIEGRADPDDENGDGISGRVNRVTDTGAIGRFGWKSSQSSLRQQTALALSLDLGLGNVLHPSGWGDCTAAQPDCLDYPSGNDSVTGLEIPPQVLDLLLTYVRGLAPQAGVNLTADRVIQGKRLFDQVGCAQCHTPDLRTGTKDWQPYTDLLLHDMGEDLADELREGQASGSEWRTAPLWGIGLITRGFLHDGRAASIAEAIQWHGGEGAVARMNFEALDESERSDIILFLNSL